MATNSSGSCSSNDALPFSTSDSGSCGCNSNGNDGGGCFYCMGGQVGGLPTAGPYVDLCAGPPLWPLGSPPTCPIWVNNP